mmetsp:Transcript_2375/g.6569  ORF Transcript_2375/g.6569 Transcript_2375/m.6569 type:complete len:259 (-) Transcript_2375:667-1443(-)
MCNHNCSPYNDKYIVASQILAIMAFALSSTWLFNWVVGLTALVMFQLIWCCPINRCGINVAASFALAMSFLSVGRAIVFADETGGGECEERQDFSFDDDFFTDDFIDNLCDDRDLGISILAFASVFWFLSAITAFKFACTDRMGKSIEASLASRMHGGSNVTPGAQHGVAMSAVASTEGLVVMPQPTPGISHFAGGDGNRNGSTVQYAHQVAAGNKPTISAQGTNGPTVVAIATASSDTEESNPAVVTFLPDGTQKPR